MYLVGCARILLVQTFSDRPCGGVRILSYPDGGPGTLVSGLRNRDSPDDGVRLYTNWPDGGKEKDLTTQITGASRENSALFYAFITALCMFMKLLHMYSTLRKNTDFFTSNRTTIGKRVQRNTDVQLE